MDKKQNDNVSPISDLQPPFLIGSRNILREQFESNMKMKRFCFLNF